MSRAETTSDSNNKASSNTIFKIALSHSEPTSVETARCNKGVRVE